MAELKISSYECNDAFHRQKEAAPPQQEIVSNKNMTGIIEKYFF